MVIAKYNRKECTLTVKGHAQFGPKGTDLVCASSSILGFTAVACAEDNREKYMPRISMIDDTLRIECNPYKSYVTPCRRMLDTIFTGYEELEKAYPNNVRTEKED